MSDRDTALQEAIEVKSTAMGVLGTGRVSLVLVTTEVNSSLCNSKPV